MKKTTLYDISVKVHKVKLMQTGLDYNIEKATLYNMSVKIHKG